MLGATQPTNSKQILHTYIESIDKNDINLVLIIPAQIV